MKRIVGVAKPDVRSVLQDILTRIEELAPHRNALAHGMWKYDPADPGIIKAVRILGKQLLTHHFTADDLQDFATQVGALLSILSCAMQVDWKKGQAMMTTGGYMSRAAVAALSGHSIASELLPGFVTTPHVEPVSYTH